VSIVYLSVEQVLALHAFQIGRYGGGQGLRDRAALEAAIARPQATFDGEDLYPDLAEKAAALFQSLVSNHPFVDGNKRAGTHAMLLLLVVNGHQLVARPPELTEIVLAVARGELEAAALAIWIRQRLRALEA
jgi:death-on-curing protein